MLCLKRSLSHLAEPIKWLKFYGFEWPLITSDEVGKCLLEGFAQATTQPMIGPPRTPARVRIAYADLAELLREHLDDDIEVVCAPTPELDAMAESRKRYMGEHPPAHEANYLNGDITAPRMASLFHAAAKLYRAHPWRVLPDDTSVISVTREPAGVTVGVRAS